MMENGFFGGDFNVVYNVSEKSGMSLDCRLFEIRDFATFIEESGLVDVPCKGNKYTWFSGDGKSKRRIDRFLILENIIRRWGVVD